MHISKIKEKFENMTVRNKILFILCLIMVMFFAVSLIGMRITFDIYGDVLYEQAYKSLNLTTRNIEHDIENIDNVSYAIVADSNIQQYLETIKDSKDALEITNDTTTVMNQMNNYASNQPFISNINFIDTRGIQSTTGLLDSYISSDAITPIAEKAAAAGGSSVFIDHVAGDDSVYLTRVIREVSKLRFDNMGTLVIRCNLNQIAAKYLDVTKGNSSTLVIFNGKNRIYRSSGVSVSDSEIIGIKSNSNYVLKDIGGGQVFHGHRYFGVYGLGNMFI
jgi:two-component system sensor histidine kinase YesM